MTSVHLRCFKKGCDEKPKYYCCNPQKPACDRCSDEKCLQCNKFRNNPLKKCFKCNEILQNTFIISDCKHSFCLKCIAKMANTELHTSKALFQDKKDGKRKEKWVHYIKCLCYKKGNTFIDSFLTKYCFCCGEPLGSEIVELKSGFKVRRDCSQRIRRQSEKTKSQSFLKKEHLEDLSFKCKDCNQPLKQDRKLCEKCESKVSSVKNPFQKKKTDQDISRIQRAQSVSDKAPQQLMQLTPVKSQMKYEDKRCLNCHDIFTKQDEQFFKQGQSQIQYILCRTCFESQWLLSPNASKSMKKQNKKQQSWDQSLYYYSQQQLNQSKCIECNSVIHESLSATKQVSLGGDICQMCIQKQFQELQRSTRAYSERIPTNNKAKKNKIFQDVFGKNMILEHYLTLFEPDLQQRRVCATIVKKNPNEVQLFVNSPPFMSCFDCGYFAEEQELKDKKRGKICLHCLMDEQNKKH